MKVFLTIAAIAALGFGLGLLLMPDQFLTNNGIDVNDASVLFARSVGCVLLGLAVINWFARRDVNSPVTRGVVYGNILLHALATVVDSMGANQGVITKMPWFGVGVHVFFIVGFLFFLSRRPKTA